MKTDWKSVQELAEKIEAARQAWQDEADRLEAERDEAYKSGKLKRPVYQHETEPEPKPRKAWWVEDLEPSAWERG